MHIMVTYTQTVCNNRRKYLKYHADLFFVFVQEQNSSNDADIAENDVLGIIERIDSKKDIEHMESIRLDDLYDEGLSTARTQRITLSSLVFCFGDYDSRRDLVEPNMCGMSYTNTMRKIFMLLAVNKVLQLLWMLTALAHNALLLVDQHVREFTPPTWTAAIFMSMYLAEFFVKSAAFGIWGARYAYLNYDIFNRLDFMVTCSSVLEFIGAFWGATFTLRGFRLFRLLRPLLKMRTFEDVGAILSTLEIGAPALATVIWLMFFVFVLFGVIGMEAYQRSFVRRCVRLKHSQTLIAWHDYRIDSVMTLLDLALTLICTSQVWADTLELKWPIQWCKRFDEATEFGGLGIHSSCGPLQRCLDVGGLGFGFTHFNHMGGKASIRWSQFAVEFVVVGQHATSCVCRFLKVCFNLDCRVAHLR